MNLTFLLVLFPCVLVVIAFIDDVITYCIFFSKVVVVVIELIAEIARILFVMFSAGGLLIGVDFFVELGQVLLELLDAFGEVVNEGGFSVGLLL